MARDFPGGNGSDKIDVASYSAIEDLTTISVAIWARIDSGKSYSNGARFWIGQSNELTCELESDRSITVYSARWSGEAEWHWSVTFPEDQWVLVVVTYDFGSTSNDPVLYFDGVDQGAPTVVDSPDGTLGGWTSGFYIGNRVTNRIWPGPLAEFAVWNRILQAAEVETVASGAQWVPDGLVAHLELDGVSSPEPNHKGTDGTVTGTDGYAQHPPSGPQFGIDAPTLPLAAPAGGVSVTPAAAAPSATAVSPTVVLGSLTLSPGAAVGRALATSPTVVLGSLTVTPAGAAARALGTSPAVVLGSLNITPAIAAARAQGVNPTVHLSSTSVTPTSAAPSATAVDPTVVLGSISIVPGSAAARALAQNPGVVLGSITFAPAAAIARALAVDPTVVIPSGIEVTPSPALAKALGIAPTTILGSLVIGPASADARALARGATVAQVFVPLRRIGVLKHRGQIHMPAETTAPEAVELEFEPVQAGAGARAPNPTVVLGSTVATPAPAAARARASDPVIPVGDVERLGSWLTGLTHDRPSGTERFLAFYAHAEHSAEPTVTAVTYGGRSLQRAPTGRIAVSSAGVWAAIELWYIKESEIGLASGSTFEVTWDVGTPNNVGYLHVFFGNVDQPTTFGDEEVNSSPDSTPNPIETAALSTNDGDMCIMGACAGELGNYALQNGFTEGNQNDLSSSTGVAGDKPATGASETPSALFEDTGQGGANRQVIHGIVLKGSTAGGGDVFVTPAPAAAGTAASATAVGGDPGTEGDGILPWSQGFGAESTISND